jgi:hypothetical protein
MGANPKSTNDYDIAFTQQTKWFEVTRLTALELPSTPFLHAALDSSRNPHKRIQLVVGS